MSHKNLKIKFIILSTIILLFQTMNFAQKQELNNILRIYIGTGTNDNSGGIFLYIFNDDSGDLEFVHHEVAARSTFLAISKNKKYLYSVSELPLESGTKSGGVLAFSINAETGFLSKINQQLSAGQGPCYISTDQNDNWVLVANYMGGNFSLLPINDDGSVAEASDSRQNKGSGVHPRQKQAHAHYINMEPNGKYFYGTDLGTDQIHIYTINVENKKLIETEESPVKLHAGAGPRHMAFHQDMNIAYAINELDGSITVFEVNSENGFLSEIQNISTLPEDFNGKNTSADIHVHPSGKFLYGSNRGDSNSIAVFEINNETGKLTLVEIENEHIAWPRNFALAPSGKWLIAANRDYNDIAIYEIDNKTGELKFTGITAEIPKPVCVKFY